MTEEQKKKCEKIINLYHEINILEYNEYMPLTISLIPFVIIDNSTYPLIEIIHRDSAIFKFEAMTISLAKIFNKEIFPYHVSNFYKEIRKRFLKIIYEAVCHHQEYISYIPDIPVGFLDNVYYLGIKGIGWAIANYFDKHFDNDNKENKNNE